MEGGIELEINRSINENAASYYDRAKELRKKAQSAEKAIRETEKEIEKLGTEEKKEAGPRTRVKREKKWFERYHWFESEGFMVLAGKDAKQNEELVARQLGDNDLFFHADIHGAPATILKNGREASEKILAETAQFAGSYSSAWKAGAKTVDVYAVEKSQVSKDAQGQHIGKGSFMISGKRTWFRNSELGLTLGLDGTGILISVPVLSERKFTSSVRVEPGPLEKGEAAREIARLLGAEVDDVLSALPSGKFALKKA